MPFNKRGEALRSKDPKHYRVKIGGKIVGYGHTPDEAHANARKAGYDVDEPISGFDSNPFGEGRRRKRGNDPFDISGMFDF